MDVFDLSISKLGGGKQKKKAVDISKTCFKLAKFLVGF